MSPLPLPLLGLAAAITLGYIVMCLAWPFGACRRCDGTGRLPAPIGRGFRLCPRCKHTGRRLRLGTRLAHHVLNARRDAITGTTTRNGRPTRKGNHR